MRKNGVVTTLVGIANPLLCTLVTSSLRRNGCKPTVVSNGILLIERMADAILNAHGSHRPSLVVVEAVLPGCTGVSVVSGLRELSWDTPIVLFARSANAETRRNALQRGFTALFTPLDLEEFSAFVSRLVVGGLRAFRSKRLLTPSPFGWPISSRLVKTSPWYRRCRPRSQHGPFIGNSANQLIGPGKITAMNTYSVSNLNDKTPSEKCQKLEQALQGIKGVTQVKIHPEKSQFSLGFGATQEPKKDVISSAVTQAGFTLESRAEKKM